MELSKRQFVKILFLSLFSVIRCFSQNAELIGTIKGLHDAQLVLSYTFKQKHITDTFHVKNDYFRIHVPKSDNDLIYLRINNSYPTMFWHEQNIMRLTGTSSQVDRLFIYGGKENNILTKFKQTIEWPYSAKTKSSQSEPQNKESNRNNIIQFIENNLGSKTGALLLYSQLLIDENNVNRYEKVYQKLLPSVKKTYFAKMAYMRIMQIANQPVVGKKAPNFTINDTMNVGISLSSFTNKYILLDFWGHWCGPCLKAFPKLKYIQTKYKNLQIIGIAAEVEKDREKWINSIKKNQLNWVQLSELKDDQGEVMKKYNILAIPTYILLNKQGIILVRTLSIDDIERELLLISDL